MRICVVGGGASGLISALKASQNHEVTIFEKNPILGKKILQTGNGRCNFYNATISPKYYHTSNYANLKTILSHRDEVLPFFSSLGLIYREINGYYYPFTNQASSVVAVLLNKINNSHITIKTNETVLNITKKAKFQITTSKDTYVFDRVILSTGSYAGLSNFNTCNSYNLAQNFNHHLNPILPSLVQLIGSDNFYSLWDGVRTQVKMNVDNLSEEGEIQLTNYGISGICTFNLSGYVSRKLKSNQKCTIYLNFTPWTNEENLIKYLKEQSQRSNLKNILLGFLNPKLVNLIFKLINLPEDADLERNNLSILIKYLTKFPVSIKATKNYSDAQVCTGGVPLEEIDPTTMESKTTKGLYLTGEILDVDGQCGGYNLGFAWLTGLIAGSNIQ